MASTTPPSPNKTTDDTSNFTTGSSILLSRNNGAATRRTTTTTATARRNRNDNDDVSSSDGTDTGRITTSTTTTTSRQRPKSLRAILTEASSSSSFSEDNQDDEDDSLLNQNIFTSRRRRGGQQNQDAAARNAPNSRRQGVKRKRSPTRSRPKMRSVRDIHREEQSDSSDSELDNAELERRYRVNQTAGRDEDSSRRNRTSSSSGGVISRRRGVVRRVHAQEDQDESMEQTSANTSGTRRLFGTQPRHLKKRRRLDNDEIQEDPILRDIRRLQNTTHRLIPKLPFARIVKEICENVAEEMGLGHKFRWEARALDALHESTEAYLVNIMERSNWCAQHAKRVTLTNGDMQLSRRLSEKDVCPTWRQALRPSRRL